MCLISLFGQEEEEEDVPVPNTEETIKFIGEYFMNKEEENNKQMEDARKKCNSIFDDVLRQTAKKLDKHYEVKKPWCCLTHMKRDIKIFQEIIEERKLKDYITMSKNESTQKIRFELCLPTAIAAT